MPEVTNNSEVRHALSAYLGLIFINLEHFALPFINVSAFFYQLPAVSAHFMMKKASRQ